jgi:hypothetical protein
MKGHQRTPFGCPLVLWSSDRPVAGSLDGFRRLSGRKIRSRSQKRTRSHLAIFAGCGMLLLTSFQPSKGGDMMCARGPLGACVATYREVDNREGSLLVLGAVPFCHCADPDVVEKRLNRRVESRTGCTEFQMDTRFARFFPCHSASLATSCAPKKSRITSRHCDPNVKQMPNGLVSRRTSILGQHSPF